MASSTPRGNGLSVSWWSLLFTVIVTVGSAVTGSLIGAYKMAETVETRILARVDRDHPSRYEIEQAFRANDRQLAEIKSAVDRIADRLGTVLKR